MSTGPVSKGLLCSAYTGYLRLIFKKEEVHVLFKDLYQKLKPLKLSREDMMLLIPHAMTVDFIMG